VDSNITEVSTDVGVPKRSVEQDDEGALKHEREEAGQETSDGKECQGDDSSGDVALAASDTPGANDERSWRGGLDADDRVCGHDEDGPRSADNVKDEGDADADCIVALVEVRVEGYASRPGVDRTTRERKPREEFWPRARRSAPVARRDVVRQRMRRQPHAPPCRARHRACSQGPCAPAIGGGDGGGKAVAADAARKSAARADRDAAAGADADADAGGFHQCAHVARWRVAGRFGIEICTITPCQQS
jgi:hypothetical protein